MMSLEASSLFSSVQLLSRVRLFATPWTAARQASLSITNSQSLLRLMSIESGMPSNHLILCHPLLLLPSIFQSSVFSHKSVLRIRWPEYGVSFSISPSNEYSGLIAFRMDRLDLLFFFFLNSTLLYSVGNWELSPANSSSKCLWEGQLSVRGSARQRD